MFFYLLHDSVIADNLYQDVGYTLCAIHGERGCSSDDWIENDAVYVGGKKLKKEKGIQVIVLKKKEDVEKLHAVLEEALGE